MSNRRRALWSGAALALVMSLAAGSASAETLAEAIALAYETNPTLQAQRAEQRALDETYVQARTALRPTLDLGLSATYESRANGSEADSGSFGLSATQPIWTGGRAVRGIDAAQADVLQGRENLRALEAQILANVVQAYVDVRRDIEALRINQENVSVLQRQLEEASARFEVGEITRTDVAQAEARLASSQAQLASAQAQLSVSRANYASVVGQSPADLAPEPALPGVPTTFDEAINVAERENANVRAAERAEQAARARLAVARAQHNPTVGLSASYGSSDTLDDFASNFFDNDNASATARVSVPLFTGGLNSSRVAQAFERANAAQINVEAERRTTLQSVSSAYAQALSARSALQAGEEAVRAATVAAEGVRQEAQVGLRTTLDVLNQELELRNAEVTLASARRNEYVAQANLLAAMGRLEGADLDPTLSLYDPVDNYRRVRNRGALPWDGVLEALDRIVAPPIVPANDAADAPIDQQLKSEIVQTAPRD